MWLAAFWLVSTSSTARAGSKPPNVPVELSDDQVRSFVEDRGDTYRVLVYVVKEGDTLKAIAKDHGDVPQSIVASYNRGVDLAQLTVGQRLTVPSFGEVPATPTVSEATTPPAKYEVATDTGSVVTHAPIATATTAGWGAVPVTATADNGWGSSSKE